MKLNQILACFSILACCLIFVSPGLSASSDQYEPDNTIETEKQILLNESGQIHNFYDSNDEDWIKFDVKKDNYYRLIVSFSGINCDPVIEIYDNNKQKIMLVDNYSINHEEQAEFLAKADGIYYARIRLYDTKNLFGQAFYGEATEYHLTLIMPYIIADKYEPDNTIENAKQIFLNPMLPESELPPGYEWEQIHNFYAPGDEDWVKFDVKKDNSYKIIVKSPGVNCDPVIEIYDNNKQQIKLVNDYRLGHEEHAEFSAKSDGIYYARIRQCDITSQYCQASYGQGTEYHLRLIMPYINAPGVINVYINKNLKPKIILSSNQSCTEFDDSDYNETCNCYTRPVVPAPDNYTLKITANGYEPFKKDNFIIKECYSEADIAKEYINLTPLSCIQVVDLALKFCADYKNVKYGITLNYNTVEDFWKMTSAIPQTDSGSCVYVGDDFTFNLCVEYKDGLYDTILTLYNYPTDPYWKLSRFDLLAKLGDVNNDSYVDLKDAILVLRIITDIPVTDNINLKSDVNGDKKIGLEDLIFVLQKVAGLRN